MGVGCRGDSVPLRFTPAPPTAFGCGPDSGSYISEGARLRRPVVCRDTFIGEGLDLDGKIVVGRRVIDAETGTWVDLEEPGLARRIPTGLGWLRSLWRFLRGRSYGRRG